MSHPRIKLSDDPVYALSQIARYLRTMRTSPGRSLKFDERHTVFWQTEEWLDGLTEIADECDRIAAQFPPPTDKDADHPCAVPTTIADESLQPWTG